ncbi:MAG: serine/threonine protein kinase, partial [Thaumarchaeota archaeon]|nr:serine/threonine protein kinase [Nitrososphaerota archaeon]
MEQIPLEEFGRIPYLNILTYPGPDLRSAKSRIKQLQKLGVEGVIFEGKTKVGRLGLVGLGTVGVVVKSVTKDGIFALKIRRRDANRESMDNEVRLMKMANSVGVGPRLLRHARDFIIMQHIQGMGIDEWLSQLRGRGSAGRARELVHRLLNQCRKLDLINLDHGQLSDLRKHVGISDDSPCIIGFESASTNRAVRNVTTAAQYLFIGGKVSARLKRVFGIR